MDERSRQPDEPAAETFGRYRVRSVLGRGGMGMVYLAEDPRIGREVAIKVIRFHPDTPPAMQVQLRRRFEVEAHSAGALSHPNIVTIYDIGEQDDVSYIAMEFVRGQSLESLLRAGTRMPYDRIVDLVTQLCRGLDFAHDHGVVHRDIKPANILIAPDGRPKIVDFGVAKLNADLSDEETRLTQAGAVIGTPAYMSPEQVTGGEVTPRSDQFSLGVIVYEMLAGETPFQGAGATTVMYRIVHEQPPGLQSLDHRLPRHVDEAVLRALAKRPEDRYPRCEDLASALAGNLRAAATAGQTLPLQSIEDLETVLPGITAPEGAASTLPADPTPPTLLATAPPRFGRSRAFLLVAATVLVAVVGAYAWLQGDPGTIAPDRSAEVTPPSSAAGVNPPPRTAEPGGDLGSQPADSTEDPRPRPVATAENLPAASATADSDTRAPDAPAQMRAEAAAPEAPAGAGQEPAWQELRILSRPAGAVVTLDEQRLEGLTPLEVRLAGDDRHQLRIELPGYRPASWAFTLADLSEDQRLTGELHFPLVAETPPGRLRTAAPGYDVTLVIDGRRHDASRALDLELPPGPYEVQIEAPTVFLSASRTVRIASDESVDLPLPAAFEVQVAATPGNCRVSIDGRFVDVTPFRARLAGGEHEFEFFWPTLDRTVRRSERITRADQRVFASADGERQ